MKKIYKFTLEITDRQTVSLPDGAEILCVQMQRDDLCMWALCNPNEKMLRDRIIDVYGTGNPIHEDMGLVRKYIGTVQMAGGNLVWHVFEVF